MPYSKAFVERDLKGYDLQTRLKNVSFEGKNIGCTGIITNPKNGLKVRIFSQVSPKAGNMIFFRRVEEDELYRGEKVTFASKKDFPKAIIKILKVNED